MSAHIFLSQAELNIPLPDPDLQKLLEEVRKITAEDWQVVEHRLKTQRTWLFGKTKTVSMWSLYVYVGGFGPWQVINFYREGSETSINHLVPLDMIVSYLYGILSGHEIATRLKETS